MSECVGRVRPAEKVLGVVVAHILEQLVAQRGLPAQRRRRRLRLMLMLLLLLQLHDHLLGDLDARLDVVGHRTVRMRRLLLLLVAVVVMMMAVAVPVAQTAAPLVRAGRLRADAPQFGQQR